MRSDRTGKNADWILIVLYLFLVLIGLVTQYAVNYKGESLGWFDMEFSHTRQLIWFGLGTIAALAIFIIDHKFYPAFAHFIFVFWLLVMIVTLIVAPEIKGARSWFPMGPFKFQPSEFAKLGTALALARYLTELNVSLRNVRNQVIALCIMFVPAFLVVLQGDLGSALVFLGFFIVLYREGFPVFFLVAGLIAILLFLVTLLWGTIWVSIVVFVIFMVAAALMARNFRINRMRFIITSVLVGLSLIHINILVPGLFDLMKPHQQSRINVLLGKQIAHGEDYNVTQSKIAIGSGGFSGKGYLEGTLTKGEFVPEQRTDFIFSTIGEEFGFVGTSVFVLIYITFLIRIILIAERQRSRFSRIFSYGIASLFFMHFCVNVGMTIGLFPVIGIPLPFVSYGGSSFIAFTAMLAILLKLDASRTAIFR